jgi:hypothetical protein
MKTSFNIVVYTYTSFYYEMWAASLLHHLVIMDSDIYIFKKNTYLDAQ